MKIDLKKPDLRKVEIGTEVITSSGHSFVLLSRDSDGKESWKDESSGLIWSSKEEGNYSHDEAVKKFKDRLPSKQEFEIGEEHGIREVLDLSNRWFWSSSGSPYYPAYAYVFFSDNGSFDSFDRSDGYGSVVCVGGR